MVVIKFWNAVLVSTYLMIFWCLIQIKITILTVNLEGCGSDYRLVLENGTVHLAKILILQVPGIENTDLMHMSTVPQSKMFTYTKAYSNRMWHLLAFHLNHTLKKHEVNFSHVTSSWGIFYIFTHGEKKKLLWSLALQKLKLALLGLRKGHRISLHSVPTEWDSNHKYSTPKCFPPFYLT
jgi:hypothetical protein